MSANLIWENVVAYSLQIGLLVGLAAFVPTLLRLKMPQVKLAYWQILLAACLILPAVRPWKRAMLTLSTPVFTNITDTPALPPMPATTLSTGQIALLLWGA